MYAGGNNSTCTNVSEQQFNGSSVAHSMTTSLDMSQAVVQHFDALIIYRLKEILYSDGDGR